MKNLANHLAILLATAWVGTLWATGYLAVPVLFSSLQDRQLAGMLAGKMFMLAGYLGIVCGAYLLIHRLAAYGKPALRQPVLWAVAVMLLLTLVIQYGIQPAMAELKELARPAEVMRSEFAGQFRKLHGISSILYLVESLLGILLVIQIRK